MAVLADKTAKLRLWNSIRQEHIGEMPWLQALRTAYRTLLWDLHFATFVHVVPSADSDSCHTYAKTI
jgi:hypothetical protein